MDSINLLGAAIISRILDTATHQHLGSNSAMDDFRRIAELTTVCKFWKDCMPLYATETLVVERSAIKHTNTSSNSQPLHSHKWATNLSFILAMSRQHLTREMRVVMSGPCHSKLLLTSALAALNILDTPWTGVEHLFFLGQGVHTAVREDEQADETTDVYAKVSLLLSILPNISFVWYYLYDKVGFSPGILQIGDRYSSFYLTLQRALLARATKLQCLLPFPSYDLLNVSGTLSCLDLNINVVKDLGCAALFNPATLQTLRLYELTAARDPWYLFTSDCRGNLTFPCLRSLIVLYDPRQVEPSPAIYSTDGLTITFPALERLYIADSTRHVLEFYKLFVGVRQSRTSFLEPVNRLQHIDPHLLTFTQAFSIFARDQTSCYSPLQSTFDGN
ncbi:hypothetical protein DL89DRAFT_255810 [Linderina pennispora]|uniref:F-box domain-containing protein n=1 Tax=Linderina pennispora TaxID=61395 RepID=A0A1Y1WF79_9FUNG|nr:uncharacterized protein DL89DRAFT_255810 [Linderina pennispora]ORX72132.1 hypothetical protein DL89DRAFT_255810 [Linderina pennispora]